MSKRKSTDAYEVGYCKPPVATQFKKGVSGNPKGRPKGARNKPKSTFASPTQLEDIILHEAYREVVVQDGSQTLTLPIAQVAVRSIAAKAAKGDHRSHRLLTDLVSTIERQRPEERQKLFESVAEYKNHWSGILRELERRGQPPPDPMPLPHPDDIVLDMNTGTVHFKGPMTPDEQSALDQVVRHLEGMLADSDYYRTELEKGPQPPDEDGTVIEPEEWSKWLAREEECLASFLDRLHELAERWPRHWPPDHLRHRLPLKWRFKNLRPDSKEMKQLVEASAKL